MGVLVTDSEDDVEDDEDDDTGTNLAAVNEVDAVSAAAGGCGTGRNEILAVVTLVVVVVVEAAVKTLAGALPILETTARGSSSRANVGFRFPESGL